tara:strand:+ start:511 stop:846 length:336 start_codon:yes stop_codon:yes gene_type:complete
MPLTEKFPNSPERILAELAKVKKKIYELTALEASLKDELEQHHKNGTITGSFESNGVKANRLHTAQKYLFSEELRNKEERYITEIENAKDSEIRENKWIKKLERRPFWRIT